MGRETHAWYEWLEAREVDQVEQLDLEMHNLRMELMILKARRDALQRRAQNRRWVKTRPLSS